MTTQAMSILASLRESYRNLVVLHEFLGEPLARRLKDGWCSDSCELRDVASKPLKP